jgi:WD40 repeat protein
MTAEGPIEKWDIGQSVRLDKSYEGAPEALNDIDLNSSSELAAGGADNIWIWDMKSDNILNVLSLGINGEANTVVLSPDGRYLAVVSNIGVFELWDLESEKSLVNEPIALGKSNALVFTSLGNKLATGGLNGLSLWDLADNQPQLQQVSTEPKGISRLAYSPDDRWLAAGTIDGKVAVFDTSTNEMLGQPIQEHDGVIWDMVFSPDGQILATAGADHNILLWDLAIFTDQGRDSTRSPEEAIEQACSIVNRNFGVTEWRQFFGDEPYRETCPGMLIIAEPTLPN